ncbi:hypothetical protein Avbf_04515 [Armadillidium vulgare]|nr:hypothetical protein Avbf_04515 [Armadillidium vulgare]
MGDEFPSDVIFVIKEKPHLYFKRINSDLIYTSRISLKTALCGGGVIGVPTLDGPTIPVPLPLGAEKKLYLKKSQREYIFKIIQISIKK